MTQAEKIAMVKTLVENDADATDTVVPVYLTLAMNKMLERLFLRRGSEGENNHEENGVNRTYSSVDDEDILSRLTPFAKVGG